MAVGGYQDSAIPPLRASLKLAEGDPDAALEELRQAEALSGTEFQTRSARAAILILPGWSDRRMDLASLRDTVLRLLPSVSGPDRSGYLLLAGLLSSALGQTDSALQLADRLEADGQPADARMLRADAAVRTGRYEEALLYLRDRAISGWYGNQVSVLNGISGRARFLQAEALFHTGRPEEALGWYGSLNENSLTDLSHAPLVEQRRKEILARLSR